MLKFAGTAGRSSMRNSEQEMNVIMSCRQRSFPVSFKIILCCVALEYFLKEKLFIIKFKSLLSKQCETAFHL